jgi:peptidylprolyl isomerase/FKBP-type peptidyl-prolyl cis-trans isomerase FklB
VCAVLTLGACARPRPAPDPSAIATAFLARNAAAPGIHLTASGLQYRILRSGPADGLAPGPADEVKVNYEGKLLSGEVFDSSFERGTPAVMTVRGLIPGWTEALRMMRPGDEWQIFLPPALGYGAKGAGPIPPGAVLVFRIEVLGVLRAPSPVGLG